MAYMTKQWLKLRTFRYSDYNPVEVRINYDNKRSDYDQSSANWDLENTPNFAYTLQIESPWEVFEEDMYQRIYFTQDDAESLLRSLLSSASRDISTEVKLELIKLLFLDDSDKQKV
jgi:hypothetical protein|tara:strand:- start:82 stop:429 length:348 start_codon:yes stop_codon:yes gene_type:complete